MRKMRNRLGSLWRQHKGLVAFLFVGGMVFLLAAIAPHAWATPEQDALRQTVTIPGSPGATDEEGAPADPQAEETRFYTDETVYASLPDGWAGEGDTVDIYVVGDQAWSGGETIPTDVSNDGVNSVTAGASGVITATAVWDPPLTPGRYDVVFDIEPAGALDGIYNASGAVGDAVDDAAEGTGFVVSTRRPVGGVTTPVAKVGLVAPFVGLAVLVGGVVAGALVWRRRQS